MLKILIQINRILKYTAREAVRAVRGLARTARLDYITAVTAKVKAALRARPRLEYFMGPLRVSAKKAGKMLAEVFAADSWIKAYRRRGPAPQVWYWVWSPQVFRSRRLRWVPSVWYWAYDYTAANTRAQLRPKPREDYTAGAYVVVERQTQPESQQSPSQPKDRRRGRTK